MSRSARARLVCSVAAALLVAALGGGCGSSPPTDKNFGTDLGADFRAPITDAGSGDTNVTPEASVDGTGTGGTTGSGGTTSGGGSGGSNGGSNGGTTGADAAAGNAGTAGTGS